MALSARRAIPPGTMPTRGGVRVETTGDTTTAAPAVAVGRQAVVDRNRRVVGYELLYRSLQPDAPRPSGEQMTADVVLSALTIGVGQLVGDKVIFCNAERSALTGDMPVTLPSHRTVIEVLETVAVDDEVIQGCADLVAQGYRLALDDFVWVDGAERLLELASIVKLDVRAGSRAELEQLARRCAPYGVRLLAEKLETDDELQWAMDAGFDYFQGYAIERPQVVRASALPPSAASHVQLAATMLTEDVDFDELERVLRREPGLVVQVLQLASVGAGRGLRREVQTVREALVLLGTVKIRQWVALTLLSGRPSAGTDGLATALVRARTCELLARSRGLGDPEFAFTAGLLSALDLLLGVPLDEVATSLDLPDAVTAAAFRHEGAVGALVAEVASYQGAVSRRTPTPVETDLDAAAAAAFGWAMPFVSTFAASPAA
jgi:EAL and modified HD-GYP domain-containing signal transduction protein